MNKGKRVEKEYDADEVNTFYHLLEGPMEGLERGRIIRRIMETTGWTVRRVWSNSGSKFSEVSFYNWARLYDKLKKAQPGILPPSPIITPVNGNHAPEPADSQESVFAPQEPTESLLPPRPLPEAALPEKKVFTAIYEASAALSRVEQMPSVELRHLLTDEMDRRRLRLALRQHAEHVEILMSLVDHCERVSKG